jgi:hypothetical protein
VGGDLSLTGPLTKVHINLKVPLTLSRAGINWI